MRPGQGKEHMETQSKGTYGKGICRGRTYGEGIYGEGIYREGTHGEGYMERGYTEKR